MTARQRLLSILVLFPFLTYSQGLSTELDSIFNDWKAEEPGGTILVNHNGKTIYNRAFGMSNLKTGKSNNLNTNYELASAAKQFTGMSIALLEQEGLIADSDELKKFYPALKIKSTITIRHLLSHTSGLREASVLAILSGKMNLKGEVRRKYNTKEYYLECLMRETDLNFNPGDELAYTNFNYILLADIVEKVSGKSFSHFCDSAIFKPLGMNSTFIRDTRDLKISNEALPYLFTGKAFKKRKIHGGIVGDHNVTTTASDMMLWEANFWHNSLANGDTSLLKRATRPFELNNGQSTHYAYGLWSNQYRGLAKLSHGGDDGGFTSYVLNFTAQQLAVIILTNSSRYLRAEKAAFAISDIILRDALTPKKIEPKHAEFIKLSDASLAAKAGLYKNIDDKGLAGILRIRYEGGTLMASRSLTDVGIEIRPISSEKFIPMKPLTNRIHFRFPTDSSQTVIEHYNEERPTRFTLTKDVFITSNKYIGTFKNESTGAKIKVNKKGHGIVARKGIIKIPLIPIGENEFYAFQNDARFIFILDSQQQASTLIINAPDFRRFKFSKIK